jgi:hypothetical protein
MLKWKDGVRIRLLVLHLLPTLTYYLNFYDARDLPVLVKSPVPSQGCSTLYILLLVLRATTDPRVGRLVKSHCFEPTDSLNS